jgi:polyhydroxyalkanoate synthase
MINLLFDFFIEQQKAALYETQRFWRRFFGVPDDAAPARETEADGTSHDILIADDPSELTCNRRTTPAPHGGPVLIRYALTNRTYILDVQGKNYELWQLPTQRLDVYMIAWGSPSAIDQTPKPVGSMGAVLGNMVDFMLPRSDVPHLNLLGHYMGGAMSTMFTALYPGLVNNLTLLAAPIDISSRGSLLHFWNDDECLDTDVIMVDTSDDCPGSF